MESSSRLPPRSSKLTQKLVVLDDVMEDHALNASISPLRLDAGLSVASSTVQGTCRVSSFCTSSEYKIDKLLKYLRARQRTLKPMQDGHGDQWMILHVEQFDECVYFREGLQSNHVDNYDGDEGRDDFDDQNVKSKREIFFFEYGIVVMWGYSAEEERALLSSFLPQFETFEDPFHFQDDDDDILDQEHIQDDLDKENQDPLSMIQDGANRRPVQEFMKCMYDPMRTPKIYNDLIVLSSPHNHMLKLAIAMAIAQSVKLTYYEWLIDDTISQMTSTVPMHVAKYGRVNMSRENCVKSIGILFKLRTNILLSSSILDTPEVFWSQRSLLASYETARKYLDITQRVDIINQRTLVISDLLDMLNEHLNSRHGENLEWIVIILVFMSVMLAVSKIYIRIRHLIDESVL